MYEIKRYAKKMNNNYDLAQELFLKCKNSGCNDILSPINWLYNQNKMLESYDVFKKSYSNNDLMVNIQKNEFTDYMDFMSENYPVGFGDRLKEHIKNGKDFDGAEIYLELINNN